VAQAQFFDLIEVDFNLEAASVGVDRLDGIEGEIVSRYGADGQGPSVYLTDPEGNNLELKGPPWAPVPTN
jgi:hypothetical protein